MPLQACYGRTFWSVLFWRSWCTAAWCTVAWCTPAWSFLGISDLIGDVFSCVGRLKRVLFACSEKGVYRQYRPPYSKKVATNMGKKFFTLLSACFPANNKLYKIINKNTIKLSYSCIANKVSPTTTKQS